VIFEEENVEEVLPYDESMQRQNLEWSKKEHSTTVSKSGIGLT
jgi:hypothetical protein